MLKSGVAGFEAVVSVTVVSIIVGFLSLPFVLLTLRPRGLLFCSGFNGYFLIIM